MVQLNGVGRVLDPHHAISFDCSMYSDTRFGPVQGMHRAAGVTEAFVRQLVGSKLGFSNTHNTNEYGRQRFDPCHAAKLDCSK